METDADLLLKALSLVFGGYVNLNMICRILFPAGMYQDSTGYTACWILGYDNLASISIFVASTVALYRIVSCHKMLLWEWSVLFNGIGFILIQNIATAILVGAASGIFLTLLKNRWFRRMFGKGKYVCIGMFLLFFGIQFFSLQEQGIFPYIISAVGKNTSFTGRKWLWSMAWSELANTGVLFGHGFHTTAENVNHWGKFWTTHLHCYYLQVLYEGGIIAFGMLFVLIFHSVSVFDRTERSYSSMILLTGVFSVMLMWQVEAYSTVIRYFFVLLFLLCNAQTIKGRIRSQAEPRVRFVFRKP